MHRDRSAGTRVAALWRALGGLFMAVIVTAAVALTSAGPAQAEPWPVNDSFENEPATRWSFWTTGSARAFFFAGGAARSGSWFTILRPSSGWASVQRGVTLDRSTGFRTCGASVYVGMRDSRARTIHLEVIDQATWTYVSNTTAVAPVLPVQSFQQVNFANFTHTTAPIVFRIGIENAGGDLDIDDLSVWCSRPLS